MISLISLSLDIIAVRGNRVIGVIVKLMAVLVWKQVEEVGGVLYDLRA